MLGILLLYFIGKSYYSLAERFKKKKWLYVILGIVSYYAGTAVIGLIMGFLIELGVAPQLDHIPDIAINLIAMPFGILACWLLHRNLENRWSKAPASINNEVLDGNF
ncbi:MAG: hypothetical protein ACK4ND_00230 [Cytophagaceae bacterium]